MRGPLIPPFYAGEIGRRIDARAAAGKPVVGKHFGQPTAGAPAAAIAVAKQVLERDPLCYFESLPLRERIARHYADHYGLRVASEQGLLTAGASAALVATYAALFRAGDRIAVVSPGYPAFRNAMRAMGLQPVQIHCGAAQGYKPRAEQIAVLDPVPAGLIVASPANPTGAMLNRSELHDLVEICRERQIVLIADEVNHGISFGARAVSALECSPNAVVINSLSKCYRMTGWRLGWMVVPDAWSAPISDYLVNMFLTPSSIAQHAALAAMEETADLQRWVDVYAGNRTRLSRGLAGVWSCPVSVDT
jgi:aspartate/methionine/tyrosine aminotransferase